MLNLVSDIELKATAGGSDINRFSSVAYSGGLMRLAGFSLPLVVDLSTLVISRKSRPILREHDPSRVVGHTESISTDGRELVVSGVISASNEHAREVIESARNGFPWQQSIGADVRSGSIAHVKPKERVVVNGRSFQGPILVARNVVLKEISFVVLGADDGTSARLAAKSNQKRKTGMSFWGKKTGNQPAADFHFEGLPDHIEAMHEPEPPSVQEQLKLLAAWDQEHAELRGENRQHYEILRDLQAAVIRGECSEQLVAQTELQLFRDRLPKAPAAHVPSQGNAGRNSMSSDSEILAACFQIATGNTDLAVKCFGQQITDQAVSLRLPSPREVFRYALHKQGLDHRSSFDRELIKAAFSSNLLPNALDNSANKALEAYYREAPASWRDFAVTKTTADFKQNKSIRPGFAGGLEKLGPTGEIKHGRLQEESLFTWQVETFAKMISFTRRDIIDDSLNIIFEAIPMMVQAAIRQQSDLVWGTIMQSAGFFTSGNRNLGEEGSALSLSSLEAAIIAMMTQRDSEGNDLDILPKYLVVPPELNVTAKAILESIELNVSQGSPTGNALRNVTSLVVEPRLSNTDKFSAASANQWFLFGEKAHVPLIFATLDQTPQPIFEMNPAAFNHLGEQMRVYQDFGCSLGDFRACYKATGEPEGE